MISDELTQRWGKDERMCKRELHGYLNVLLYVSLPASFRFKGQVEATDVVSGEFRTFKLQGSADAIMCPRKFAGAAILPLSVPSYI